MACCLLTALLLIAMISGCVRREVSSKSYPGFEVETDAQPVRRSGRSTRDARPDSVQIHRGKADPLGDIWRGFTGLFDGDDEKASSQRKRVLPAQDDLPAESEPSETPSPFADP